MNTETTDKPMYSPEIILIAAVAQNGIIGRDNALPWRLKADLARFRSLTLGHPVLMGRKTWASLGKALPGRRNIVLSRSAGFAPEGAETYPSVVAALTALSGSERVFVIGGAEIYRAFLPEADALFLTEVAAEPAGDAHFPEFDRTRFQAVTRERHAADADNEHAFDFVEYRTK